MAEANSCILRISDEKTLQLIDLYQKEECLWNTTVVDYRNKMKRAQATQKIARILNIPNFTPRHVTMKFKNLRNSYSQELKKIAASNANDQNYQPTVFWFDQMDSFIRPHLQAPRGGLHSNLVYIVDGKDQWAQISTPEEVLLTESIEPSGSENECETHTRKRKSKNDPQLSWKRFRENSESDERNTTSETKEDIVNLCPEDYQQKIIASSLKDMSAKLHLLLSRNDDYFDSFGKYIAGLLRSLPPRKALEVQPQIISVITAAGVQNLVKQDESENEQQSFNWKNMKTEISD